MPAMMCASCATVVHYRNQRGIKAPKVCSCGGELKKATYVDEGKYSITQSKGRRFHSPDYEALTLTVSQRIREVVEALGKAPEKNTERRPALKAALHETVAKELIEQLEAGTAPWQKPWLPGELPYNPVSGNRYKGFNAVQLAAQGRKDPRWLTYKQAKKLGAQVLEGEKATTIVYWVFNEEKPRLDGNGKPVLNEAGRPLKDTVPLERPKMLHASVFNAEQMEGLPALEKRELNWSPIQRAESILAASGAKFEHETGDRSFYRLSDDTIHMPRKEQFADASGYYSRALHELAHWSGHPSRLGREIDHPYGSQGYAREELRAEITSMLLGQEVGIGYDPKQHAAYVGEWIKLLQNDPLEIFRATADAEKAQAYIVAFAQEQQQTQSQANEQKKKEEGVQNEEYQKELRKLLILSSLTPGDYRPSESVRDATHAAVFVESKPLILCGHYADKISSAIAIDLAKSNTLPALLHVDPSALTADAIAGSQIDWKTTEKSVVEKASGKAEDGTEDGPLSAIVLDNAYADPLFLATSLCVIAETARILSPAAPKTLDDGVTLSALACGEEPAYIAGTVARRVTDEVRLARRWMSLCWDSQFKDSATPAIDAAMKALALAEGSGFGVVRSLLRDITEIESQALKHAEESGLLKKRGIDLSTLPTFAGTEQLLDTLLTEQALTAVAPETRRQYINVPFQDKEKAKALGARWDRQEKSWYIPSGFDPAPFAEWRSLSETAAKSSPVVGEPSAQSLASNLPESLASSLASGLLEKCYLAVPYGERMAAKAAGALWDPEAKAWYAGPKADMDKLSRWFPNGSNLHNPAMSPRDEFADALKQLGCVVTESHPILDGQKHRIETVGDKKGERSGFYVGHMDGHPAGYIKNNRTGVEIKWKSKGYTLTPEDKAKFQAEAAAKLAERAQEQARLHEATAVRVASQLKELIPAASTPYLELKGVKASPGIYTDAPGETTYVPAFDVDGKHWNTQYIRKSSEDDQKPFVKRFAKDSRKEVCFHPIGGFAALEAAPAIVIAEGYATAKTLSEALGYAAVAAFDSGNLLSVATVLQTKYPDKAIVIAGDDDQHVFKMQGINPGRSKAKEAAAAVGGRYVFPVFAPGEQTADPAKFTDFNDLAANSSLGKEAVERQIKSAVDKAIKQSEEKKLTQTRGPQHLEEQKRKLKVG